MSEPRSNTTDQESLPKLRMNAYYFAFSETGVRCVDEILSAVACAGKGYHHTEDWAEGGYIDQIQSAAGRAAALFDARSELIKLAKQYASECAECGGTGMDSLGLLPCIDCEDILKVIAKAEGKL